MNAATMMRRYGREPVSAYIGEGWNLLPLEVGGVAFHRVGRVAITVGAPLGLEEDADQANAAFRRHCRSKGWSPVVFQTAAPVEGLRSHLIAREAFIDVGDFSLSGSAMANARHSVSRARRDGMTVSWQRWSECNPETRAEMKLISDSWAGRLPELTFTYGRLSDIPDDAWVGLAVAAGGRIEAISTWRPLPAGPGMVLDLMRRRKDSTPGAMELMIVEAVEVARSEGLAWLSLGAVCQSEGLPRWLQIVLASAAACGGSGLSSFKEKFRPRWEDRYLALPANTAAVAGVLALAIAHVRGARVRPEPAQTIRLRRPALRWAAAAGMTFGLSAYGLGAAATDIGWPVGGQLQLSLASAAERAVMAPPTATPSVAVSVDAAPVAAQPPASTLPAPAPSQAPSTTAIAGSAQVAPAGSDRSVATLASSAPCAPTEAIHSAVGVSKSGGSQTQPSPGSTTATPGTRCGTALKAPPATPSAIAPSAQPATRPATASPAQPATRPAPPPPASKKTTSGPRGNHHGDPSAVSQSAHNTKIGRTDP